MAGPNVQLGTINRLRASVVVDDDTTLSVTASFLLPAGISIAWGNPTATNHKAMVGTVPSPEPYQEARVKIPIVRTTALAQIYKQQIESDVEIGTITVRPDTSAMTPWQFQNCTVEAVDDIELNGQNIGYVITISGYYPINNDLYNG